MDFFQFHLVPRPAVRVSAMGRPERFSLLFMFFGFTASRELNIYSIFVFISATNWPSRQHQFTSVVSHEAVIKNIFQTGPGVLWCALCVCMWQVPRSPNFIAANFSRIMSFNYNEKMTEICFHIKRQFLAENFHFHFLASWIPLKSARRKTTRWSSVMIKRRQISRLA